MWFRLLGFFAQCSTQPFHLEATSAKAEETFGQAVAGSPLAWGVYFQFSMPTVAILSPVWNGLSH